MSDLTPALLDLMKHEKVIEQGLHTFVEVGRALLAIHTDKKYRAAGYKSFDGYCQQRWGFTKRYAAYLVDSAKVIDVLEETGTIVPVLPGTESQARELALLLEQPDVLAEAWTETVELAEEREQPVTAALVAEVVATKVDKKPAITKPDLGGGISHPARYSPVLLPVFASMLRGVSSVLDPFGGTGERLAELAGLLPDVEIVGVEIEPEWAAITPGFVRVGSALALEFDDSSFDAICTSPCYGNRLADHHNASDPESRRSYTHDLGHALSADNSGDLQWGDEYREFHIRAWKEASRVLCSGGLFVLNISDHIRDFVREPVSAWHAATLLASGLVLVDCVPVVTSRLGQGENAAARVDAELVWMFEKP